MLEFKSPGNMVYKPRQWTYWVPPTEIVCVLLYTTLSFFYFRNISPLSIPLSVNGSIVSFWQRSCSAFTLCFSVVFTWIACFFLLLCLRPAELICCNSGSPLVTGVPAQSWKIFVVVGFVPTSLLGFNASPFLAFAVAGLMVFPTSPRTRRGVVRGALSDWKDFAAPKLLPVYQYLDIKV